MATSGSAIDPIHQFVVTPLAQIKIGGIDASFTNASLFMVIVLLAITFLMIVGTAQKSLVPGRLQAAAEMCYETVMSMCTEQIGHEGKKFFPIVFCLLFFILFGNFIGVFPYFFTFTSHIAVTLALSSFVFILVTAVALERHGLHFFSYFVPQGIPAVLAPLMVLIEVISYLSRIISLSVRLFANMMAGHVMLEVFGSFVVMLGGAGALYLFPAGLSLVVNVALIGFELLVATLQAYVFAILTCIYLHDAVHLH